MQERKDRPTPEFIERVWEGSGYGARRDRRPFRYQAFVPDPIGDWDEPITGRAAEAVATATAAVRELQSAGAGTSDLARMAVAPPTNLDVDSGEIGPVGP